MNPFHLHFFHSTCALFRHFSSTIHDNITSARIMPEREASWPREVFRFFRLLLSTTLLGQAFPSLHILSSSLRRQEGGRSLSSCSGSAKASHAAAAAMRGETAPLAPPPTHHQQTLAPRSPPAPGVLLAAAPVLLLLSNSSCPPYYLKMILSGLRTK